MREILFLFILSNNDRIALTNEGMYISIKIGEIIAYAITDKPETICTVIGSILPYINGSKKFGIAAGKEHIKYSRDINMEKLILVERWAFRDCGKTG